MTRTDLATAGDLLESAADATRDETVADRAPDHGRLARIELALDDVTDGLDDDPATEVDEAHEHVIAFRETVEGV